MVRKNGRSGSHVEFLKHAVRVSGGEGQMEWLRMPKE
jgi:hypothetical protein